MGVFILLARSSYGFPLEPHSRPCLVSYVSCPSRAHADKLQITSTPPGATVELDGVAVAPRPSKSTSRAATASATLKLSPGSHAVLLKFPGHADWRRTLEVLKSSKVSLKATLEPIS